MKGVGLFNCLICALLCVISAMWVIYADCKILKSELVQYMKLKEEYYIDNENSIKNILACD